MRFGTSSKSSSKYVYDPSSKFNRNTSSFGTFSYALMSCSGKPTTKGIGAVR